MLLRPIARRTLLKSAAALVTGVPLFASSFQLKEPATADPQDLPPDQRPHGDPKYAAAKPIPSGPFEPTWTCLRDRYTFPAWFHEARFGIFIHWGVYSVPARINEWYARHMYTSDVKWHTEHYGPPDKFGYKDLIPLFKASKWDPEEWAQLFKDAGANYVVPVAEHHDGFAMWDSALTRWNAKKMGPHRDVIGELSAAVRRHGMIFGVSDHRMEHHTFMYPAPGVPNDQFDPAYADFYGPPVPGNMNDGNASKPFQEDWLARAQELVDKYQPQLVYFDNGVNPRAYDDVKLRFAAYYFNRAAAWNKGVVIATKDDAYPAGSVIDFEKSIRAPHWFYPGAWQVDDAIGSTWGYTTGERWRSPRSVIEELVDIVSRGGNLLLNVSPDGDGVISEPQQKTLRAVGRWLSVNGEAIYGSGTWHVYGEGPSVPSEPPADWRGGSSARHSVLPARKQPPFTANDIRFTTNHGALYAILMGAPPDGHIVRSLTSANARIHRVSLLGVGTVKHKLTAEGLHVTFPAGVDHSLPPVLKVEGFIAAGM